MPGLEVLGNYLLSVLATIHRTGSVTLAGKALSLSQPATSNALARLRDLFEDELFVRAPSGLKPTRLCEQLGPAVLAQFFALETLVWHSSTDKYPAHQWIGALVYKLFKWPMRTQSV